MHNFINISWEILILKYYSCLQPSFAQHLKSLELFEKLNLRKKDNKLPTCLLLLTYRGGVT